MVIPCLLTSKLQRNTRMPPHGSGVQVLQMSNGMWRQWSKRFEEGKVLGQPVTPLAISGVAVSLLLRVAPRSFHPAVRAGQHTVRSLLYIIDTCTYMAPSMEAMILFIMQHTT